MPMTKTIDCTKCSTSFEVSSNYKITSKSKPMCGNCRKTVRASRTTRDDRRSFECDCGKSFKVSNKYILTDVSKPMCGECREGMKCKIAYDRNMQAIRRADTGSDTEVLSSDENGFNPLVSTEFPPLGGIVSVECNDLVIEVGSDEHPHYLSEIEEVGVSTEYIKVEKLEEPQMFFGLSMGQDGQVVGCMPLIASNMLEAMGKCNDPSISTFVPVSEPILITFQQ